jgi:hypothetical protein
MNPPMTAERAAAELDAMLDQQRGYYDFNALPADRAIILSRVAALKFARDTLRVPDGTERDAARYRWLRDEADSGDIGAPYVVIRKPIDGKIVSLSMSGPTAEGLDAAIDAQLAAAPPSDAPGEDVRVCRLCAEEYVGLHACESPSPAEQGAREAASDLASRQQSFGDEIDGILLDHFDKMDTPLAAGRVGVQTWRETIGGMKPGPALFEGQQLYVRIEDLERCDTEWAENYAALANEREALAGPLVAGEAWLLLAYAGNEPSVAYHCRTRADVERAYRDAVFGGDITGNETEATEFMQTFDDADEWAGSRLTINYEDGGVSIFRITGPLVYADTAKGKRA